MLFQVGPIGLDTYPLGPEGFSRNSGADLPAKPVMGGLQPREYMGEADQNMTLTGQILPTKLGGLAQIDQLHALSTAGTKVPVMRGDGKVLGWYVIEKVTEQHKDLTMLGVGFSVAYSISLVKVDTDGAVGSAQGGGLIGMLQSLFEVL